MVASNDFVDLIYHNRQAKSATLRDFFSTLLKIDTLIDLFLYPMKCAVATNREILTFGKPENPVLCQSTGSPVIGVMGFHARVMVFTGRDWALWRFYKNRTTRF
jgi:hypothetical protein